MRSTIVFGNVACAAIQRASAGSRAAAYASTMPSTVRPLCGRLSQQTMVSGPAVAARRAANPAASRPIVRAGDVGMREVVDNVRMRAVELPVAGSWQ